MYFGQCGWDGYSWGGRSRMHFRFSDSGRYAMSQDRFNVVEDKILTFVHQCSRACFEHDGPPASPLALPPLAIFIALPSTGAYKHAGRRDSYRPYIDNDDLGDPTADFAGVVCIAAGEQDGQRDLDTLATATRRGSPTPGACRWGERASTGCYSRAGAELWRTDGTAKGTRRVDDLRAGISGSFPSDCTVFDGALFYAAHTDLTGTELFRSDGTSGGANIVEVQWAS